MSMSSLQPIEHETYMYWNSANSSKKCHGSAIILKSGILHKKGEGVMSNTYKERLFELKINGELIYYEVKSNGDKIKKDAIILNPNIKIEKRSGGTRRDAKFIVHINKNKKWYLWCNNIHKQNKNRINKTPSSTIYKYSPKSKTNLIGSSNYYSHSLFPYTYNTSYINNNNNNINNNNNNNNNNKSPQIMSSYTSLSSISIHLTNTNKSNIHNSLLSPNTKILIPDTQKHIKTSINPYDFNYYENGQKEAQEWCDILKNVIQNIKHMQIKKKQKDNAYKSRSKSYPLNKSIDYDIDEHIEMLWTIKQSYIQLKNHRVYKEYYFQLHINGELEYYSDITQKHKCGSIDILNECINIEKRKGSQKRDCKFILYNKNNKSYYFWCKNNKHLCFEWYYLIKRIISDKMKNINHYLEIANRNKSNHKKIISNDDIKVNDFDISHTKNSICDS